MAVFWHDKRRQIVSQNNFADITMIHEEITLCHYANDLIPNSQPIATTNNEVLMQNNMFTFNCASSKRCTFCGFIPFNIYLNSDDI